MMANKFHSQYSWSQFELVYLINLVSTIFRCQTWLSSFFRNAMSTEFMHRIQLMQLFPKQLQMQHFSREKGYIYLEKIAFDAYSVHKFGSNTM